MSSYYERAREQLAAYSALDGQRSDPLAWWHNQAVMERARALTAEAEVAQANSARNWSRECAIVALRMLRRAGKVKALTDDEDKVIEWAKRLPELYQPAANRRLGSPFDGEFSVSAEAAAQAVLFDFDDAA
jgi:hypothetical protein